MIKVIDKHLEVICFVTQKRLKYVVIYVEFWET